MTFNLRQSSCICLIFSAFVAVHAADFAWKSAGPGIETLSLTNSRPSPVLFTAVRIARADFEKKFNLVTTLASNTVVGLEPLPAQIRGLPKELGEPVAAINGDFFVMVGAVKGDPRGLQIAHGELVSDASGPAAFWIDSKGQFHGEQVQSRLEISWPGLEATAAGLNEPVGTNGMVLFTPRMGTVYRNRSANNRGSVGTRTNWVMRGEGGREWLLEKSGAGPWLPLKIGKHYEARAVESFDGFTNVPPGHLVLSLSSNAVATLPAMTNGVILKIAVRTDPDLTGIQEALGSGPMLVRDGERFEVTARMSDKPHPRSGIGWNDDFLILAVADGRQPGISVGVTLPEFADFMIDLGCQEAIDMDGGQSTTLMLNDAVINHPADGRPRDVANGVVVLRKPVASKK